MNKTQSNKILAVTEKARHFSNKVVHQSARDPNAVDHIEGKRKQCTESKNETFDSHNYTALRSTDVGSWNSSAATTQGGINTDSDPKTIQHWSVVAHFYPEERKCIYLKLGTKIVDFKSAVQCVWIKKSSRKPPISARPNELLKKATMNGWGVKRTLRKKSAVWASQARYFKSTNSNDHHFNRL